jgi:endonuclease/exonuclease/phosphatase family metal-dependent hydrolase
MNAADLVVASYNIHRCLGTDGVKAPERIAAVLRAIDADVIALQEVDSALPEHGVDQLAYLAGALGYEAIAGPTLITHTGRYGNALLTRVPVRGVRRLDLSVPGREPRNALDVDLDLGPQSGLLRVVATHFGLRRTERLRQATEVARRVAGAAGPQVFLGDVNEWLPGVGALELLRKAFDHPADGAATYPSRFPLLRLDQIFVRPSTAVLDVAVHTTALSRVASDHLPVRARLCGVRLTSAAA